MLRKLLLFIFSLTISINSFAKELNQETPKKDKDTGGIFWDLDAEIRLEYIPICKLNGITYSNSNIFNFMKAIDLFSVLGREQFVHCKERGFRVVNKLREDKGFTTKSLKRVFINDVELYLETTKDAKTNKYSENYQPIYSAIQSDSPVIVTIGNKIPYKDSHKELLEQLRGSPSKIKVTSKLLLVGYSELDEFDKINYINLQNIADKKNNESYKSIVIYNLIILLLLIIVLFLYRSLIHPILKNKLQKTYREITKYLKTDTNPKKPDVGIIKADKMKSYSVADELIKWTQLKEDGHITEKEYQEARKKLLE